MERSRHCLGGTERPQIPQDPPRRRKRGRQGLAGGVGRGAGGEESREEPIASPCLPGIILSDFGRRIWDFGAARQRLPQEQIRGAEPGPGSNLASIAAGKRGFGIWKGAGRAGTATPTPRALLPLISPSKGTGAAPQELCQQPGRGSSRSFPGLTVPILFSLSIFPPRARPFLSPLLPPAIIPRNFHLMIRLGPGVGRRCHSSA